MIAVDSSVLVAIFADEPDRRALSNLVVDADAVISAASVLECSIVMRMLKRMPSHQAEEWLDSVLDDFGMTIAAVTLEQSRIARAAHIAYGKGTGHGANLNFGDCFSYALAMSLGVPLLYKGKDFAQTDIVPVLA